MSAWLEERTRALSKREMSLRGARTGTSQGEGEPGGSCTRRCGRIARGASTSSESHGEPLLVGREVELRACCRVCLRTGSRPPDWPEFALISGEARSAIPGWSMWVLPPRRHREGYAPTGDRAAARPYGEDLTFSAVGEIVKAQRRDPETDDEDSVRSRTALRLPAVSGRVGCWRGSTHSLASNGAGQPAGELRAWLTLLERIDPAPCDCRRVRGTCWASERPWSSSTS